MRRAFGWVALLMVIFVGLLWPSIPLGRDAGGQNADPVVLAVLAAGGAYLWSRTTVESEPGFPVRYSPPPGLSPVQREYIRTEAVSKDGLTATLFDLAERKLVALEQADAGEWTLTGIAEANAWTDVDPVSVAVGSALKVTRKDAEFRAAKTVTAGKELTRAKYDMGVAFLQATCAILRWGFPSTSWCVPFFAFFVFSVRFWRTGVGRRRTEAGRLLWSQADGFHRLLSTDSAGTRFDFAARKDLYPAYIPFAIASGSATLWAKKYRQTTGSVDPQPDWYRSSSTGWLAVGGSSGPSFDGFDSALSPSIGAYSASLSGGGGFGGGGGGGGSW